MRPLRRLISEEVYSITNRTLEGRFLFLPGEEIDEILGSCLARAVHKYGIILYDHVFMANHFHMELRAPRGNLSQFMACFQSMLAKELNRHHGRRGPVFERRYVAIPILDEHAFIERLVYTLNNPVKAGLVSRAKHYAGLSSYRDTFEGKSRSFTWLDRTRWWKAGCPANQAPFEQTIELKIEPLSEAYKTLLREALLADALRWEAHRRREGKTIPSPKALRKMRPSFAPKNFTPSPQPRCHTTRKELRLSFEELWHRFRLAFRDAAELVAQGKWKQALFPIGSFPPTRIPVQFEPGLPEAALLSL